MTTKRDEAAAAAYASIETSSLYGVTSVEQLVQFRQTEAFLAGVEYARAEVTNGTAMALAAVLLILCVSLLIARLT